MRTNSLQLPPRLTTEQQREVHQKYESDKNASLMRELNTALAQEAKAGIQRVMYAITVTPTYESQRGLTTQQREASSLHIYLSLLHHIQRQTIGNNYDRPHAKSRRFKHLYSIESDSKKISPRPVSTHIHSILAVNTEDLPHFESFWLQPSAEKAINGQTNIRKEFRLNRLTSNYGQGLRDQIASTDVQVTYSDGFASYAYNDRNICGMVLE